MTRLLRDLLTVRYTGNFVIVELLYCDLTETYCECIVQVNRGFSPTQLKLPTFILLQE